MLGSGDATQPRRIPGTVVLGGGGEYRLVVSFCFPGQGRGGGR